MIEIKINRDEVASPEFFIDILQKMQDVNWTGEAPKIGAIFYQNEAGQTEVWLAENSLFYKAVE